MGINRSSFSGQSITENTEITIEMLLTPPDPFVYLDTPVKPSTLYGFYNDALDLVQLYVTDSLGRRFIPVI